MALREGTLDWATVPLDAGRRRAFFLAQSIPGLGKTLVRRDPRILAQSSAGAVLLLLATLYAPGALLVLGPALFGVAHVASDVRYLVLRRDASQACVRAVMLGSAVLLLLRVAEFAQPAALPYARAEAIVGWGLAAVCAWLGARGACSLKSMVLVLPPLLALLVAAAAKPITARWVFAHAHNVIALSAWALLFRRRLVFALPALFLLASGGVFLASGAALPFVHFDSAWAVRAADEALGAAPRWVPPRVALGLGLSFLYLQAAHYSVWLAWVPQEDLRTEGTLSFRMSVRAMMRDLGPRILAVVGAIALLVALASILTPHRTRYLYLSLASFHGYLELAMLAYFAARAVKPATEPLHA